MVKPDMFMVIHQADKRWVYFYEYASDKNFGKSEQDRIKNMRLFLTNIAKWYELCLVDDLDVSWSDCTASFLTPAKSNPIDRWD